MKIFKNFYFNRVLKKLANLQLAIFLLFTIGILIAFGTIIEQDQNLSFYQENYPENKPIFGFITWKFITSLGLDNIYTNSWFFLILSFFGFSLIACTFTTQLPSLKKFKLWKFFANLKQIQNFNFKEQIECNFTNNLTYQIYKNKYHIFRQGKKQYSYSGLLGRVGPIIVHFSIIVLLLGTSFGSFTSYNVQEIIPRGEVCHLQNLVKSSVLSKINPEFAWRVNNFWITYTKEGQINQFYSDLSILNNKGNELKRKTIFVNEPLVFENLTIYQTDWDILGIKVNFNNDSIIQFPAKKITKSGRKFWLVSIPLQNKNIVALLNDLKGNILLYDDNGVLLKEENIGTTFQIDGENKIKIDDILVSTGLQIKEDPGIRTIYFAFFLIMISVYISFLSYSQIWTLQEKEKVFLAGTTNRAVLTFQEDFKKLNKIK